MIYLLIRRWLPAGRLGGLAYRLLLLVIAATTFDPLRADNPDFDIVGPGWVAVAVFSAGSSSTDARRRPNRALQQGSGAAVA